MASAPYTVEVVGGAGVEVPVAADFAEIEPLVYESPDVLDIFEFDDESGDEHEPAQGYPNDEEPEEDSILVVVEEMAEVLPPPVDASIEAEIGEPAVENEAAVGIEEDAPPPLNDLTFQDVVPEEFQDRGAENEGLETCVPESHEPELVVSPMPKEEPLRELPLFLDDADDFVPRIPTLSERDADRALTALAEARARAEQGGLLRCQRAPVEVVPAETEAPSPVSPEEVLVGAPQEVGEILDEPTSEVGGDDFDPEEELGTLSDRIERFVVLARSELGATAAAISDRDGFLLFTQSDREGDEEMETALLLEVAGKTDRLLGVEHASATQVSTDGGAWRCLIRGGDGAGDLYAGFRLQRPLDQVEIVRWRNALAEIISPTPELR